MENTVPLLTCLPLSHLGKELSASFLWVCRGSSMSDSSDDERPAREEEVTWNSKTKIQKKKLESKTENRKCYFFLKTKLEMIPGSGLPSCQAVGKLCERGGEATKTTCLLEGNCRLCFECTIAFLIVPLQERLGKKGEGGDDRDGSRSRSRGRSRSSSRGRSRSRSRRRDSRSDSRSRLAYFSHSSIWLTNTFQGLAQEGGQGLAREGGGAGAGEIFSFSSKLVRLVPWLAHMYIVFNF